MLAPFEAAISGTEYRGPPDEGSILVGAGQGDINLDAQKTHSVLKLKAKHSLSGDGLNVGVWDQGSVLERHREFGSRVVIGDSAQIYARHATHVGGTIAASGIDPKAQGMAPRALIQTFDWSNDASEMCQSAMAGPGKARIVVSNHSYGIMTGWEYVNKAECKWEWRGRLTDMVDAKFGKYGVLAQAFDTVLVARPTLTAFSAAGNDGNDDPRMDPNWNGNFCADGKVIYAGSDRKKAPLGDGMEADKKGNDTISGHSIAKNVITIGAVLDIVKDGKIDRSDIKLTSFSSKGPSDDGRIKPDLVANGYELFSPALASETLPRSSPNIDVTRYRTISGTSMASPTAAGIGVLLNELSLKVNKRVLYSNELKAALIHTAIPATADNAPNYDVGWGLIDSLAAGDLIAAGNEASFQNEKAPVEAILERIGSQPIRVTIAWLDPASAPIPNGVDIRTKTLVKDLDLTVTSPDGKVFRPWSLDPAKPQEPATRTTKNDLDNVERVDIAASEASPGDWKVVVSLPEGEQAPVAIFFSGLKRK